MSNLENSDAQEVASVAVEAVEADKAFRPLSEEEMGSIKKSIENATSEYAEHRYIISTERSFVTKCIDFIEHDVKYDGKDALGVIRLHDALQEAKKEAATLNSEEYEFGMTNMHIEALYYYLQKVNGTGFRSAHKLAQILEPVLIALNEARAKSTQLQSYVDRMNAKLHGLIDPDEEISMEITNA